MFFDRGLNAFHGTSRDPALNPIVADIVRVSDPSFLKSTADSEAVISCV